MVSKRKEEERRFQIELLKTEVDLENQMALLIGTIALEFAIFIYYGETGQVTFQLIAGIALLLTVYVMFPLVYDRTRKRRFKDLEEKFISKKKNTK
jgi:hypothetical protein